MIILASKSKARRDILKNLGVEFKVIPARIKEISTGQKSPEDLAKYNARLKAQDVARRIKEGIVLGCDTFVWQDGRIYGKPKDLKEAKEILKRLTAHAHYLYTGITIIDAETKKMVQGVEKTRIVMEKLSEKEINDYFKRVSPLDKAGGFDISGIGSVFIKRIEGCYFNVVGLPVYRMSVLLKKLGISLL